MLVVDHHSRLRHRLKIGNGERRRLVIYGDGQVCRGRCGSFGVLGHRPHGFFRSGLAMSAHRATDRKAQNNQAKPGNRGRFHGFQPIVPPSYTQGMSIVRDAAAIAKGMSITLKQVFQPTEVENYPDGKGPMRGAKFEERFRGKHQLQRDENGLEKCVACFLCAAACPSNCIYIEAAENTEEKRISSAERYAKVYNIDYNRCIFCGYCVEACPTDAITHGHGFELATLNATNLVMRKEDLLVPMANLPDVVQSTKDQAKILA
jgi:NADH-quinone oxidoreductase subunit I